MMHARLIFSGDNADRPFAEALASKLSRRDIKVVKAIDAASPQAKAGKAALVVLLSPAAARSDSVRNAIAEAAETGLQVFVLRTNGLESDPELDRLLAHTLRVAADGDDPDRDLSRFANKIAAMMRQGRAPTAQALHRSESAFDLDDCRSAISGAPDGPIEAWREMERTGSNVSWSWEAAILGPLWTLYRALPVAGFVCLAVLILVTALAASIDLSVAAPLIGFIGAWLFLALVLGLLGLGMLRNHVYRLAETGQGKHDWFRPVGMVCFFAAGAFTVFLAMSGGPQADLPMANMRSVPTGSGKVVQPSASSPNPILIGEARGAPSNFGLRWQMREQLFNLFDNESDETGGEQMKQDFGDAADEAARAAADAADAAADAARASAPDQSGRGKGNDNEIVEEIFDPTPNGPEGR